MDPAARPGDPLSENSWDWTDPDGLVVGRAGREGAVRWIRLDGVGTFRFRPQSGSAVTFEPSSPESRVSAGDIYRRSILPCVLEAMGHPVLHASAVETPSGLLVLAGGSGAGKSTTASMLARHGFPLWADDAVAFDPDGTPGPPRAWPLPFHPRLWPDAAERLAREGAPVIASGRRPTSIAAVVCLERPGEKTEAGGSGRPKRLEPAVAFRLLLPHAYCFDPEGLAARRRLVDAYLALADRVTAYRLRRRDRLDDLPDTVARLARLVEPAGAAG